MSNDLPQAIAEQALRQGFSGSYLPAQVQFLLRQTTLTPTVVDEKERLIQSGQKHYSQMIGQEMPPSAEHLRLYDRAMSDGARRYACEVAQLANRLGQIYTDTKPIVLVSFVRAGVPLGVLLNDALHDLGRDCVHYGISIIRDKGIDFAGLACIIAKHGVDNIVFVDGWTGKGAIKAQLMASLGDDKRFAPLLARHGDLPLVTLADVAGCAWLSASFEDWLIPSGILGSTISGLISRSILQTAPLSAMQIDSTNCTVWHSCVYYTHLAVHDVSQSFVATINELRRKMAKQAGGMANLGCAENLDKQTQSARHARVQALISDLAYHYQIDDINRIKPGIAEATRAILRRVPKLVLLQERAHPSTALLRHLAQKTHTPVQVVGTSIAPYHAITFIDKLGA